MYSLNLQKAMMFPIFLLMAFQICEIMCGIPQSLVLWKLTVSKNRYKKQAFLSQISNGRKPVCVNLSFAHMLQSHHMALLNLD